MCHTRSLSLTSNKLADVIAGTDAIPRRAPSILNLEEQISKPSQSKVLASYLNLGQHLRNTTKNNLQQSNCQAAVNMLVYETRECTMMLMPLEVIVSSHNSLGNGRYYDVESSSSFAFDHTKQVCLIIFFIRQGLTDDRKQAEFRAIFWKAINQILCRSTIL